MLSRNVCTSFGITFDLIYLPLRHDGNMLAFLLTDNKLNDRLNDNYLGSCNERNTLLGLINLTALGS